MLQSVKESSVSLMHICRSILTRLGQEVQHQRFSKHSTRKCHRVRGQERLLAQCHLKPPSRPLVAIALHSGDHGRLRHSPHPKFDRRRLFPTDLRPSVTRRKLRIDRSVASRSHQWRDPRRNGWTGAERSPSGSIWFQENHDRGFGGHHVLYFHPVLRDEHHSTSGRFDRYGYTLGYLSDSDDYVRRGGLSNESAPLPNDIRQSMLGDRSVPGKCSLGRDTEQV